MLTLNYRHESPHLISPGPLKHAVSRFHFNLHSLFYFLFRITILNQKTKFLFHSTVTQLLRLLAITAWVEVASLYFHKELDTSQSRSSDIWDRIAFVLLCFGFFVLFCFVLILRQHLTMQPSLASNSPSSCLSLECWDYSCAPLYPKMVQFLLRFIVSHRFI
jgi:hypothetical protein